MIIYIYIYIYVYKININCGYKWEVCNVIVFTYIILQV